MQGGCEARLDYPFIGCSGDVALGVTPLGSRVVSLHEFGEVRCEVVCWVMGVVLMVDPFVSLWRDESG